VRHGVHYTSCKDIWHVPKT